jgi:ABC-2 type transport system permease protein
MLIWGIGMASLAAVTALFFPFVETMGSDLDQVFASLPEAAQRAFLGGATDHSSPEGYLRIEIFTLAAPALIAVFAINLGATAIAGEEANRTLSLLLSSPISRSKVVLGKWIGLALATGIICGALYLGLQTGSLISDINIGWNKLFAATLSVMLFGLCLGTFALAMGCRTGTVSVSQGLTALFFITGYLQFTFIPLLDRENWISEVSLYSLYMANEPLVTGLRVIDPIPLLLIITLTLISAIASFRKRDLHN